MVSAAQTTNLLKILSLLPALSQDEKDLLKSKLNNDPPQESSRAKDLFYVIREHTPKIPWSIWQRYPGYAAYLRAVGTYQTYIDFHFKGLTRVELVKVDAVLIRLVAEYIKKIKCPVTMVTMAQQLDKIDHITNLTFPDYARCGLLKSLIRKQYE